jgi:hypothetical protein
MGVGACRLKLLLEATEKVEEYSLFFDTRLVTELKGNLSVVETSAPIESVDTFLKTLEVYSSLADKLHPSSSFKCSNDHKASSEQVLIGGNFFEEMSTSNIVVLYISSVERQREACYDKVTYVYI